MEILAAVLSLTESELLRYLQLVEDGLTPKEAVKKVSPNPELD